MDLRRKLFWVSVLYFAEGFPFGVAIDNLPVYFRLHGVSLTEIGLMSLLGAPWTLKVLWAPLVDRFALPWPGRRRSWVMISQAVMALVFGALAAFAWRALAARAAGASLGWVPLLAGLLALAVAFVGATQDIASDAYAVELLRPVEHGAAPGVRAIYYRLGMLLAGAVAVGLSDFLGWPGVFLLLGGLFAACIPLVLACPEPENPVVPARSLAQAVAEPFRSFFSRADALPIAFFLVTYKLGDNMAGTMVNPFLKDLCFSNVELGAAVKTIGIVASMLGSAAAVALTLRLGVGRALWIFGAVQALANLLYAGAALTRAVPLEAALCASSLPALDGATRAWAYAAIAGEQGAQAMASVAQGALLLRVCSRQTAVTQFALLTSLFALGRWGAGLPSGFLVEALGYPLFFTACATVVALPGFIFLQRVAPFGQRDVTGQAAPP
jgi:PAT family beta-lactamase induction signal transducer AmpG